MVLRFEHRILNQRTLCEFFRRLSFPDEHVPKLGALQLRANEPSALELRANE